MSNSSTELKIMEYQERKKYFLQQQTSDYYILANDKAYPVHKLYITQWKCLSEELQKQQARISILQRSFKQEQFLAILKLLYGYQLLLGKDQSLLGYFQIGQYLQFDKFRQLILQQVRINYEQHGIFILYSLGQKYKIQWLKNRCKEDLILMQFQQMNINKLELFQCQKSIFDSLLLLHSQCKQNKVIKGINNQSLKKIVHQYNQYNNLLTDIGIFFLEVVDRYNSIKEIDEQFESSSYANTNTNNKTKPNNKYRDQSSPIKIKQRNNNTLMPPKLINLQNLCQISQQNSQQQAHSQYSETCHSPSIDFIQNTTSPDTLYNSSTTFSKICKLNSVRFALENKSGSVYSGEVLPKPTVNSDKLDYLDMFLTSSIKMQMENKNKSGAVQSRIKKMVTKMQERNAQWFSQNRQYQDQKLRNSIHII